MGDTEKGIWGTSITQDIFDFFRQIKLQNYRNFIDLGSGDGKVVLIASLFGINAAGIEFDKDLIKASVKIRDQLKLNAEFMQGDFLEQDLFFCSQVQAHMSRHSALQKIFQRQKGQ